VTSGRLTGVAACVLAALPAAALGQAATATAGAAAEPIQADAAWQFSGDEGKTWQAAPPVVPGGKDVTLVARATFTVPAPTRSAYWKLTHGLRARMEMTFDLNGKAVAMPLKKMYYKAIPAIPAAMLAKGRNVLTVRIRIDNRPPRRDRSRQMLDVRLPTPAGRAALAGQRLAFQTGPVLGAFGTDWFSVTCRTTVPAVVTLIAEPSARRAAAQAAAKARKVASPKGLYHRFRVRRDPSETQLTYRLLAVAGDQHAEVAPVAFSLPEARAGQDAKRKLRFIIMGDSRSRTDAWAKVAAAALKEKPAFVVFTGDMCDSGPNDWQWDEHYFAPPAARQLLATVPFIPIKGNHEEDAPAFTELFYTPSADGRAEHWAMTVGPVLVVGINGQWHAGYKRTYRWVEQTLAGSKAKFILLATHYPAYSSAGNGKLDSRGRPRHWAYQTGRKVIIPMLTKYKAAAFVCAHEHHYERSDLPGGLRQIIAGSAGAPTSSRSRFAARQNPYAKVFVETTNYALFEVAGETCTFTAKAPSGKVLDTLTFKARPID